MPPVDPPPDPDTPDAATPADILTPHKDAEPKPAADPEPEVVPGIIDPRRLGPEIVDPPPPGLPAPAEAEKPADD